MPQSSELLWYVGGIGVAGAGAMLVAILVSRVLAKRLGRDSPTLTFTLQDLREMRDRGELNEREYDAMRSTIIRQTKPESHRPSPAEPAAQPPPS